MPGQAIVVPPGSQVVQTPIAYPCGGEQAQAAGVASGQSAATSPDGGECREYPKLAADIILPAVNGMGQLRAPCAAAWAVPGLALWLPPFGQVKVTGVSGDLVTFENLNIPPGSVVGAGAVVVPAGPAETHDGDVEAVSQLDEISGWVNGVPKRISGSPGDVLRFLGGRWVRHAAGSTFYPVNNSTGISGNGATFKLTAGNMAAPGQDITLPSKPSVFGSGKVVALLEVFIEAINSGAVATAQVNNVIIARTGSGAYESISLCHFDVTNLSAINVRLWRSSGTGNVNGHVNVLGYFA